MTQIDTSEVKSIPFIFRTDQRKMEYDDAPNLHLPKRASHAMRAAFRVVLHRKHKRVFPSRMSVSLKVNSCKKDIDP